MESNIENIIKNFEQIPRKLTKIKQPPKQLFYKGDIKLLNRPIVAIIGSRKLSQYTKQLVYELSNNLSKIGFTIVSGGALGTDIEAHKGAFPNTICIMANSLEYVYPKTNKIEIEKMGKESLLISEYEWGIPPHSKRFIHRNRLIVGISDFVIIAQANERSGTLQSINIALREGKKIYALPQRLEDSPATNRFIAQGQIELIYNLEIFIKEIAKQFKFEIRNIENKEELNDPFILFCKTNPTYDELFQKFPNQIFEYEFDGKIEIRDGKVFVV